MTRAAIINLPSRECLVLWVHANDLLADASFDLSNVAKHFVFGRQTFFSPTHACQICAELDAGETFDGI
jgi:hypothetical protein